MRRAVAGCLLAALLCLTGCLPSTPLSQQAIVLCMGIDYSPIQKEYQMTVQVMDIREEKDQVICYTAGGQSLRQAADELGRVAGKQIFSGDLPVLFFGSGVRYEELDEICLYFEEMMPLRPKTQVAFSPLPVAPQIAASEENLGKQLESAIQEGEAQGGLISCPIFQLKSQVSTGGMILAPCLMLRERPESEGELFVQAEDVILYTGGQFGGTLSRREAQAVNLLSFTGHERMQIPLSKEGVLEVVSRRPQVQVSCRGEELSVQIGLTVNGKLRGLPPGEYHPGLAQQAAQVLQGMIENTLRRRLEEGCDVFGLERYVRKYQNAYYEAHREEILRRLAGAQITVQVSVQLTGN